MSAESMPLPSILFRFCSALCVTCLAALASARPAPAPETAALGKIAFELIDNRIFVNVTINGHGPFHMILDTGASLAVSPEVAQKAGLTVEGSSETGGVGEKSIRAQDSHVRELSFGAVHLSNLDCQIISTADSAYVFGKIPVDGFFGLEVFENYVVRHDYQNKELTFYDPKTYVYSGSGEPIPFERQGNIAVIRASFDGIVGRFGVDTGARSALILYGPFVADHHLAEKYQPKFQGVSGWGLGGPVRSFMVRSESLTVGQFELHGLIARFSVNKSGATATSSKAGLIGPDVLKQFTFICDYSRHRLIFEKNSDFGHRDSYDRAGMWLSQKGDNFEVFDVIPGGPADQAGLKVGEEVLAIDGNQTAQTVLTELREHWKTADSGTKVKLQVEDASGAQREVKLILRDLV
jgi:Aspartyl protease/PDZ domain